jgi:hypothetical protein
LRNRARTSRRRRPPRRRARPKAQKNAKKAAPPKKEAKSAAKPKEKAASKKASKPAAAREGSKKEIVLDLLRRKEGATMAEIAKATGWQNHSIRGFISGQMTKRMGLTIESSKNDAGEDVQNCQVAQALLNPMSRPRTWGGSPVLCHMFGSPQFKANHVP